MSNTKRKKKILVLGGGLSGLAAAHELTNYPGWNDHYDVSLYQMGWRLGGKCATGRGGKNDRIEEHGIHVFLGFYNNAIRMVREAFDEWKATDPEAAQYFKDEDWQTLFSRQDSILLPEYSVSENRWLNWPLIFPTNELLPGIGGAPSKQVNLKKMLLLAVEMMLGSPYLEKNRGCLGSFIHSIWRKAWPDDASDAPKGQSTASSAHSKHYEGLEPKHPHWWKEMAEHIDKNYQHVQGPKEVKYLHHAKKILQQFPETEEEAREMKPAFQAGEHHFHKARKLVHEFTVETEKKIASHVHASSQLRRWWTMVQLAWTLFKGALEIYDSETGKLDFEKVNHLDFREWMKELGAHESVRWCAPVKDLYTLVFAYPNGDTSKPGQLAAGTALLGGMLIILGYKGSVMWKFRGGTAGTIVSPIYEVLKSRGVAVEFFHEVEEIFHSTTGEIEKVKMGRQIRLADGREAFHPTRPLKGREIWASHPFWAWPELKKQINPEDLEKLMAGDINLNSAWSGWQNDSSFDMIKGQDFDQIVLAIPVAALKDICRTVIKKEAKWQSMVDKVQTVQTQAVQLWLKDDLLEMGMDLPKWGIEAGMEPIMDTYANPINSWAEMTSLIEWENWPKDNKPGDLAYFCGPMLQTGPLPPYSDTAFPQQQNERVVEMAAQWLADNAAFMWPLAGTPENPTGLDLDLLVDPDYDPEDPKSKEADGQEKLRKQFFRANIDPSERYTLSVPDSTKSRLKADESGFHNLFLCGDWIDTGYNMGCAEVAVMSGLMAAQALREKCYGLQDHKEIIQDL
jgi:uncharacterized protein with NAD-binding domain and iron-sulfur cluster